MAKGRQVKKLRQQAKVKLPLDVADLNHEMLLLGSTCVAPISFVFVHLTLFRVCLQVRLPCTKPCLDINSHVSTCHGIHLLRIFGPEPLATDVAETRKPVQHSPRSLLEF